MGERVPFLLIFTQLCALVTGLPTQLSSNSYHPRELREKQVQSSRPEMAVKQTQVESVPERPQPLQVNPAAIYFFKGGGCWSNRLQNRSE